MQYEMPTQTGKSFHKELKSSKNMQFDQNESMEINGWSLKHPSIQDSFYQKIDPPKDLEDAQIKMNCHQHAIKDFELQIEMNELEIDMLKDGNEVLPYNVGRADELETKKLKLLLGKRFHQNASNAYWYYMAKQGKWTDIK